MAKAKWNLENVKVEALKYDRRYDFLKGSVGAYEAARRNGWLDLVCEHMEAVLTYHTLESVKEVALKYNTRAAFQYGDKNTYEAARRNGWLDLCCEHMTVQRVCQSHTLESVKEVALKYPTRKQFETGDKNTYNAAHRNGWLDIVCGHMEGTVYQSHTLETVQATALKYNTRSAFSDGDIRAYDAARRNGWLDLCCEHMERGLGGYDPTKPGTLYYLQMDTPNSDSLYKIGITNYPNVQDRIKTMQLYPGVTATVLKTVTNDDGAYIAKLEKKLHKHFRNFQYTGPNIMDNGNTELFTVDVRGWGALN